MRETNLPGVFLLSPRTFADERGFFLEIFNERVFAGAGLPTRFVQDNHSRSLKGVLRGLHYQLHRPQGKLVHCVSGSIFDVAVDIRKGSPTFGRWTGATLDDVARAMLWIPPDFAHGYCAISDSADVVYKCTEFYVPKAERGIAWNDPSIGIDWPLEHPVLSSRDAALPFISASSADLPRYQASSR